MSTGKLGTFVAAVLCGLAPMVTAQEQGVVTTFGGSLDDAFHDVIPTVGGGVVATGYTVRTAGGRDVLLVKIDGCGDPVWTKRLGGSDDEEGRSVIELPGGNLVVAGHTSSFGGEGDHVMLSRFTSSGDELWTTVLTDPSGELELRAYDVIRDSNGDLVVTGTVWTDALRYSVLIAKFDAADGSLVGASRFHRPLTPLYDYWGESLVEACDGDYVVVGGLLAPGDDRRVLLTRIRSGLLLAEWGRWIQEGSDDAVGHSITVAADGALVLTGETGGLLFLSKRDCAGSPVPHWQQRLRNDSVGHSVIQTSGVDEIVVAGELGTRLLAGSWTTEGSVRWIRGWADGVGYAAAEDVEQRSWVAGSTDFWGAGGLDALGARLDADGYTCLEQHEVPLTPIAWNPAEDDHAMTWHDLPVAAWDWEVESQDVSLLNELPCDDECPEECCLEDGTCDELTPDDCSVQGGQSQGPGSTCEPAGGCCLAESSCVTTTEICCDLAAGAWQGTGTACTAPEACCLPDMSCVMVDPLCCDDLGGVALGAGSECQETWSCCLDDGATCAEGDPGCCVESGGVTGRLDHCAGDSNANGIDDACEPQPIPTVSEWGLIIMTALLLAGGINVFRRQQRTGSVTR